MQHAIEHLQHELAGVRTGRANPGLIENISVDANGEHMPVKACGTVTVRNPQLLAITLYDARVSEGEEACRYKQWMLGMRRVWCLSAGVRWLYYSCLQMRV
jgi:hypothetical protein